MAYPDLSIDMQPREGNVALYLPLSPKAAGAPRRLKIGVRLIITNNTSEVVEVTGISFSFPGSNIPSIDMHDIPEAMDPHDGQIPPGGSAMWCNGRFTVHEEVYLDYPPPPQIRFHIVCKDYSDAYKKTMDLTADTDTTGNGAVIMPFSHADLDDGEFIVTSAVHTYRGGESGGQIFAHDMSIEVRKDDGVWTNARDGVTEATENTDHRVFGRPVRAIANGEVFYVEDGHDDNPEGSQLPNAQANYVRVRHGDLEVYYSHLRRGSIIVAKDEPVVVGQQLAEAGNSGNTGGFPHLHMEGRDTSTGSLRGFLFRNAKILERSQVEAGGSGPWVFLDSNGVCEEKSAILPIGGLEPPLRRELAREIGELLVGEIYGGVAKDGGGWVIVGGKFVRVPPRGPKWALLQSLIALDAAQRIQHPSAIRIVREIADTIGKIAKDLKKER